jgi:hypothetical protein
MLVGDTSDFLSKRAFGPIPLKIVECRLLIRTGLPQSKNQQSTICNPRAFPLRHSAGISPDFPRLLTPPRQQGFESCVSLPPLGHDCGVA